MMKIILFSILIVILLCVSSAVGLAIYKAKKDGKHIGKAVKEEKQSHFSRLFLELPYRYISDLFNREDYEFTENGLHLFTGEQGCGKTITLVYMLMKFQRQYPNIKVRTNMCYLYENGVIDSWEDIVFQNNGKQGQIDVIDEIQTWFSSLQSKNFPVDMLGEVSQQRKQTKIIMGTSQVWQRVAKPIREQVKLVYKPRTLFGCLTICFVYKPVVDNEGQIECLKFRKVFYFVHNDEIRNCFDTYQKIVNMSRVGFKEKSAFDE